VDIDDLSPNGEGLGRVRGFSVFVANAKPGEHVKVRINRVDSMSADATIVA
jgi:predicted RNA-binding protein with TRAM domain